MYGECWLWRGKLQEYVFKDMWQVQASGVDEEYVEYAEYAEYVKYIESGYEYI